MNISSKIRLLRICRKKSLRNTAISLGLPTETYIQLEKGLTQPGKHLLRKLAAMYKIPLKMLVDSKSGVKNLHYNSCTFTGNAAYVNNQYLDCSESAITEVTKKIERLMINIKTCENKLDTLLEVVRIY